MSDDEVRAFEHALIEWKKRSLKEDFGCTFHGGNSSLPPEVEWDWLHYVEEFERQFRNRRQTTVRRFVGNPDVQPLQSLTGVQLPGELERLLDILADNSVLVHFDTGIPDIEMYRFLSGELLDQEMDDIRIPGMTHNFIYEEFHPPNRADA